MVAALFVVADALGELGRAAHERGEGIAERADGAFGHLACDGTAAAERERRRCEQTFVELDGLVALSLRIVGDDALGEPFKQPARGQEDRRAEEVERRVRDGDTVHRGGFI